MQRKLLLACALLARTAGADEPLPATMRAAALTERPWDMTVHLEKIQQITVKVPQPGSGQVLVKVAGSSVNPVDWKMIENPLPLFWSYPHIFGRDCAGTVVALGEGVQRLKVGDRVWVDTSTEGCFAEYAVLPAANLGIAPSSLPLEQAATLPLVGLTGLQAFEAGRASWVGKRFTALVLGGSGGTGHVGIQVAKALGAGKVITTCGTPNVQVCRDMGADEVIDYHKADWHTVVPLRSVDVVYDTVGIKGTGNLAYDVLRDGGFFATLLPQGLPSPWTMLRRHSIGWKFVLTDSSNCRQLDTLRGFVEQGKLKPYIQRTFTIAQAAQAFNASMAGHSVGKISVVPGKPFSSILV